MSAGATKDIACTIRELLHFAVCLTAEAFSVLFFKQLIAKIIVITGRGI